MTTVAQDKAALWGRIPAELRGLRQWCVAGAGPWPEAEVKAPRYLAADGTLHRASVTNPAQWMDFNTAAMLAWQAGLDIGFVLSAADPYACIDLDVKDAQNAPGKPELWTKPEQFDLYYRIMKGFASYAEASRSGKGLHIWVRANIGKGVRRDGVEVYSQERFIICTGNVVQAAPIEERHAMLCTMVTQMRPAEAEAVPELVEVPQEEDDWSVLVRAVQAGNADKFCGLWLGQWEAMGFPSQSEADLALMSMFTFYSPSNEQCRRLFRESALGKREKAVKNNAYLNRTLVVIRGRQAREAAVDLSGVQLAAQAKVEEAARARAAAEVARLQSGPAPLGQHSRTLAPLHVPGQGMPPQASTPVPVAAAQVGPVDAGVVQAGAEGMAWPPGFMGRIAQFIYQSSPRPVKEVAIVAALGLMAGLCGKGWHIPQSGLNLYIVLIARSGVGKEAMHSGISNLIKACTIRCPTFHNFIDFSEYASGPALIKACAGNPCFVNVSGEWGRKLKLLAQDDRGTGPLATLRTQMTNLYQKSGPQAIVGGIGYSDKEKSVGSIAGVSYSLIGESTPSTFYEALTQSMMEDGFLSRFLTISYDGPRPPSNPQQVLIPDAALQDALVAIATQASTLTVSNNSQPVGRTEGAARMMQAFELECDHNINSSGDNESKRQMWNRAALKMIRVAALLAVADNYVAPVVQEHHVEWALDVVRRDITTMNAKMDGGDVGVGDDSRERKLVAVMRQYLAELPPASYKINAAMHQNSIVPRGYLQMRTGRVSSFYSHRLGHAAALDATLANMVMNGYIMEVDKAKMVEAYNVHGKCYRILRLPEEGA